MTDSAKEIRREYIEAAKEHYRRTGVLPPWSFYALTKNERDEVRSI